MGMVRKQAGFIFGVILTFLVVNTSTWLAGDVGLLLSAVLGSAILVPASLRVLRRPAQVLPQSPASSRGALICLSEESPVRAELRRVA